MFRQQDSFGLQVTYERCLVSSLRAPATPGATAASGCPTASEGNKETAPRTAEATARTSPGFAISRATLRRVTTFPPSVSSHTAPHLHLWCGGSTTATVGVAPTSNTVLQECARCYNITIHELHTLCQRVSGDRVCHRPLPSCPLRRLRTTISFVCGMPRAELRPAEQAIVRVGKETVPWELPAKLSVRCHGAAKVRMVFLRCVPCVTGVASPGPKYLPASPVSTAVSFGPSRYVCWG